MTDEDTDKELEGVEIELIDYDSLTTDEYGEATVLVEEGDDIDYSVDLENYKKVDETREDVNEEIEIPIQLSPEEYSLNPWLEDAKTDNGGVFWNAVDEQVPMEEGDRFSEMPVGWSDGDEEYVGQPFYANSNTEEDITFTSKVSGTTTSMELDVYEDEIEFGEEGYSWYRIPTGSGTPYPDISNDWDVDGNWDADYDYELVEITENDDGFEVEWEYIEKEWTNSFEIINDDEEVEMRIGDILPEDDQVKVDTTEGTIEDDFAVNIVNPSGESEISQDPAGTVYAGFGVDAELESVDWNEDEERWDIIFDEV